jgi:hypothetical protein
VEAAAREQEQQVSSEDSETCIVNQLRVYHKSKERILFFCC